MAAASIGPVKAMLLALDAARLQPMLDALIDAPASSTNVRAELRAFADAEENPL